MPEEIKEELATERVAATEETAAHEDSFAVPQSEPVGVWVPAKGRRGRRAVTAITTIEERVALLASLDAHCASTGGSRAKVLATIGCQNCAPYLSRPSIASGTWDRLKAGLATLPEAPAAPTPAPRAEWVPVHKSPPIKVESPRLTGRFHEPVKHGVLDDLEILSAYRQMVRTQAAYDAAKRRFKTLMDAAASAGPR